MTKIRHPKITIIIAVFNGEKTLQRCLDSIARQSYSNIESIILDGGSTDNTISILEKNASSISYWISEPDSGIYDAWNKGINQAAGDWVWFLGADDYFFSDTAVENYIKEVTKARSEARVIYSKVMLVNQKNEPIFAIGETWDVLGKQFLKHMSIPHQGVLHHISLFSKDNRFDLKYKIAGDYEFLLRELPDNKAYFVPQVTVCMQVGGVSNDPYSSLQTVKEIRMAQKKHGQPLPSISITLAKIRAYLRVIIFKCFNEKQSKIILDKLRKVMGKEQFWTNT